MSKQVNVDPIELEKFSQVAHHWWDLDSEFRPLHEMNPHRLNYVASHVKLAGARVLDVGCGGGILTEALAKAGADATGIDLAKKSLQIAQLHALDSGLSIDYRHISVEELADAEPASFDVVSCMEMLEHVPSPNSVVQSCARLVKPNGWVFLSTLNRNLKSYLLAVVGAEYIARLLTPGTHDFARFIKPSELARMARSAGLEVRDIHGLHYDPLRREFHLEKNSDVNYLMALQRVA